MSAVLRPILEADLGEVARFATDPDAGGEFEWTGFGDPGKARRRWEEDGWLGEAHSWLAVDHDGTFAGIVSWRDRTIGNGKGLVFEIGLALLPEHRGQGVGTEAHRLLIDYLWANTPAHRIQAFTESGNVAEQRTLEKVGFEREGVLRHSYFRGGEWRDSFLYALLR